MNEKQLYYVVMNDEEQYALWPKHLQLPAGWMQTGRSGTKEECMAFVKEMWTDLTPLSLR